jgi:hypothetical protein
LDTQSIPSPIGAGSSFYRSIVPDAAMPYTAWWETGNAMSLFSKIFDTRTLVKIIGALSALLAMKAAGAYLGFSWMAALASG